jgi:hypothetical protein
MGDDLIAGEIFRSSFWGFAFRLTRVEGWPKLYAYTMYGRIKIGDIPANKTVHFGYMYGHRKQLYKEKVLQIPFSAPNL